MKLSDATVTVQSRAPSVAVPPSFLGLSTEYWAMPVFERNVVLFERILAVVHDAGDGPLVLRIGGDSANHAVFDPNVARLPNSVFDLSPDWFRRMSRIVTTIDGRVILDLNLVADRPRTAGLWAQAALTELPPGSISGFEIGNEPDLFNRRFWLSVFSPLTPLAALIPPVLTPTTYVRLFDSYARVLARMAPRVPLVAPAVAYPVRHPRWITTLLASPRAELGMVSAHEYPYSACAAPGSRLYPTIPRLLSEGATAGVAASLKPVIRQAHRAGVSDSFATALWAPDALFELLRAGVDGVNIHVRAYAINAAFAITRHGVVARPLLYGLIMFVRTLGQDPRLVALQLHAQRSLHLKAWAVRVAGGVLHVLLINKGTSNATVRMKLPVSAPAAVQRLLAPSVAARSGMTLDGQRLGPHDNWERRPDTDTILPGTGGYQLTVPAMSAALISVRLLPAAPSRTADRPNQPLQHSAAARPPR